MSTAHSTRTHALLSPSGAHRWLTCTPSALLEDQFPQSTSEYAEEGTLAHELCEVLVRNYTQETSKRAKSAAINKLKKHPLWKPEMMACAETYFEFIKSTMLAQPSLPTVVIEKRVDLTQWVPEGSGIADCILLYGSTLHVIDYKHGKGVPISAENNPQLMLYALGAYAAYGLLYPVKTVKVSIVQPRLYDEPSTWETTLEDLLSFGEHVRERAALAAKGEGEFAPSEDACRFCRARQTCRARADYNVRLAFETKDEKPVVETMPALLTLEEIGKYLVWGKDVAKWLDDLKDYALAQALAGNDVTGWKAVEGRGSRDWTDQETAFEAIIAAGTPESVLYERKPLTLAQVEKVVGKKAFEEFAEFVVKKPGKPTLVEESDKREAITNAEIMFKEEKRDE